MKSEYYPNYTYDEYGQLVKSILLDQNQVSTTTEYTYDLVGNRLKQTEVMFAEEENAQLKQTETTYAYNTLDQLVSSREEEVLAGASAEAASSAAYTYDAAGNLISVVDSVEGTENTYTYDPIGQMTSCWIQKDGTVLLEQENAYNGDGQRISRMENDSQTVYFYQDGTLLMTEDGNGELDSFYYLGISGNPLALMESGSDAASYYLYQKDAQGSTRAVTGADGTCAEWYSYTDFGETTIHEELDGFKNVICYTGGMYDESTELYYLNARYYNPETGRFLSRDTYRRENAKTDTLHLYSYCANDPVNYVGPSGHFFDTAIDIISVGWSAYDMVKDPSLKNAAYLIYDVGATILPYIPASRTYKAIDSAAGAIKISSKAAKTSKGKKAGKAAFWTGKAGEKMLETFLKKIIKMLFRLKNIFRR